MRLDSDVQAFLDAQAAAAEADPPPPISEQRLEDVRNSHSVLAEVLGEGEYVVGGN